MSIRYALIVLSMIYLLFWGMWYVWFAPILRSRLSLDFVPWRRLKGGLWATGMIIREVRGIRWMRCVPGGRVMLVASKVASADTYGDLMLLLMAVGRVHQWCSGDPIWLENIAVFLAALGMAVSVVLAVCYWDYLWLTLGVLGLAILHGIFLHWDEDAYWRGIMLLSSSADIPASVEANLRKLRLYPLFPVRVLWGWAEVLKRLGRVFKR